MAQKERQTNKSGFIADMGLTAVAVLVVGVTFFGVSGLTPRQQNGANSTNVLGVNTSQRTITYKPEDLSRSLFISDFTITDSTRVTGDSRATISFNPLEATTYRFALLSIRNTTSDYKKVRLTPTFSLNGSYTSILLVFAGQTTEIVSSQGVVSPLDLVLPPNSSSATELVVQPVSPLAMPTSLTLSFTELP